MVQAATWTLGDEIRLGLRIGVFEQDSSDGNLMVDADYTMWFSGFIQSAPNVFANQQRTNLWTHYHLMHFATGNEQSMRVLNVNVAARASLASNECLGLYTQTQAGSVALRWYPILRTYVVDEG